MAIWLEMPSIKKKKKTITKIKGSSITDKFLTRKHLSWRLRNQTGTYKKSFNKEEVGNVMTLVIGSAAGALSSSATFPLDDARKHMQAGTLNGRHYNNMLHALMSILEKEGLPGLYRGLGPSCLKLVPVA
ncbi:hypothetical protein Lal_00031403, partial [Lupinus albus]